MSRPDILRILETCVRRGATEVLLMPGKPPVCRFVDTIRNLAIDPLRAEDVPFLAIDSLAPNLAEPYRREGFCRFDYPYPHRNGSRIRVFVIRHGESHLAILTPVSAATPELEYWDVPRQDPKVFN